MEKRNEKKLPKQFQYHMQILHIIVVIKVLIQKEGRMHCQTQLTG